MIPVDAAYRVSARSVTLSTGHRHKSAPAALERHSRGLADRKDTDRLMATVEHRADSAPDAICPACGLPPQESFMREELGAQVAQYVCTLGHLWITRWVAA